MPEGNLDVIFRPKSVAVIGASPKPGNVGGEIVKNLLKYEFQGAIYPVNPNRSSVHGIKCYPTISAIPDHIDLAVIVVPCVSVPQVLEECGRKGTKGAVIISAGFREVGGDGVGREKRLAEIAKAYSIRVVGPNCMGVMNTEPDIRMDATFAITMPVEGKVGLMSQSGAICAAILDYAREENIGFAKFVSMGNKMDVSGNDLLQAWEDDEKVSIILMYIESFGNPKKFVRIARRVTKRKPVIAVKAGRTAAGAAAAASHTGAMAGLDVATDAIFEHCGVLRVGTIEELFSLVKAFVHQPLPKGNRVAVVTNAGGPGIMATDACIEHGLHMAGLDARTVRSLRELLPPAAAVHNPVDMLAQAGAPLYEQTLEAVLSDRGVDAVIAICVPPVMIDVHQVADTISTVAARFGKPVLGVFMARREGDPPLHTHPGMTVPVYSFPEAAVKALSGMAKYRALRDRPHGKHRQFEFDEKDIEAVLSGARARGGGWLSPGEVGLLLKASGINTPMSRLARTPDEAAAAAAGFGFPVVLKVVSPDIVHKSDVKGVVLDLRSEAEVREAFAGIVERAKPKGRVEGVLVQQMVRGGREAIIGMMNDPQFGPLLMFGLGGVYVEVLKDVTFRATPLTDTDAAEMVRAVKGFPLLSGIRGEPPSDIPALEEALLRLSQLVSDHDGFREIDLNPVVAREAGKGCVVLDARIALGQ